MTESGRDDRNRHAGIKHLRCHEVTEIVKSEVAEACGMQPAARSRQIAGGSSQTTGASLANPLTRSVQDSNPNRRHTATFESQRVGFLWRAGAVHVTDVNRWRTVLGSSA
jgi:hypothetical protein